MDAIVENIAPQICANNPTEECPIAVDAIIRNGLPLLAAASDAQGFGQVLFSIWEGVLEFWEKKLHLQKRFKIC